MNIGIIGAGDIAQEHLKVLRDLPVDVIAVCNRGEERRLNTSKKFNIPNTYEKYEDMFKNHKLDAVFVLVTIENMGEVCLDCAKYGIPLFVEKPIGLSINEVKEIKRVADENNTKIMVGVNRRFMSTIMKAKEIIGGLKGINIEAPERFLNEIEDDENSKEAMDAWIYANGVHCIDLLRFFGGDVKEVVSLSDKDKQFYNAQIKFENCVGQYRSYWDCPGGWQIFLYGDKSKVTVFPLEKGIYSVRNKEDQEITLDELDIKYKPGFYRQIKYFIDRVENDKSFSYPASDINDTIKTMELISQIEN